MTVDARERDRRRALLKAHLEAEFEGDTRKVMATFAPGPENLGPLGATPTWRPVS